MAEITQIEQEAIDASYKALLEKLFGVLVDNLATDNTLEGIDKARKTFTAGSLLAGQAREIAISALKGHV